MQPSTPMALELPDLLALVADPTSADHLREYFGVGRPADSAPLFTGGRFESLNGGGDRADAANAIGADDLVAVQLLSVRVPGKVALELLEGLLGKEVAAELAEIPTHVALGTPAALSQIEDGGHADRAWHMLDHVDDVGYVTAGKLLARKRPRLVPVYDGVVKCAYGRPKHPWQWLHEHFKDGTLPDKLVAVRDQAGVPNAISPLRVLDVIVWMRHHRDHKPSHCPRAEFTNLVAEPGTR